MAYNMSDIEKHIATHTVRSVEDCAAVGTLEYFLKSGGKVLTDFSKYDRWPNHDGFFEFVPKPAMSRRPKRIFMVQIKGTSNYIEKDGCISYNLQSLAFPAFIDREVTADPGILFVVLNPMEKGKERVFWKYMSPTIISSIDFSKNSKTIVFTKDEEIVNSEEGSNYFCKKLEEILDKHLFLEKLSKDVISESDALEIIDFRCKDITDNIESMFLNPELRDEFSRYILRDLYDLCYSVLGLNAIRKFGTKVNERLAWETAGLTPDMKYLSNFLKGLKYLGTSILRVGQSERVMLKYHSYLWEIRNYMLKFYGKDVIPNLNKFPTDMDKDDIEYYSSVAKRLRNYSPRNLRVRNSRYFVQKQVPIILEDERFFEITLQFAELYATKYNRITVYSKNRIVTDYSVQIAYSESEIELWGIKSEIKLLDGWIVSIAPSCLNKMAKMVNISTTISHKYGEYTSLMVFLRNTGQNLFDLINLSDANFEYAYRHIYEKVNSHQFGDVITLLRKKCSYTVDYFIGQYTLRYAMICMRERVLSELLPANSYSGTLSPGLNISKRCYPFEKSPFTLNLVGTKSSRNHLETIHEIVNDADKARKMWPYIKVSDLINRTGELYYKLEDVASEKEIYSYNDCLDFWEIKNGYSLVIKDGLVTVDDYEKTTILILKKIQELTQIQKLERADENEFFVKNCGLDLSDVTKMSALKRLFVKSQVLLVYGAAGTGKTTLLKYISVMRKDDKKLVLAKTHTALQNLKRRLPVENTLFASIDSAVKSSVSLDYDIIFIDECSTIDNETMKGLLGKLKTGTSLVLSGDIYQIESIEFGNWFYYAKDIISSEWANVELLHNWRTNNETLIDLWQEVREKKPIIIERLAKGGAFSDDLGESIFCPEDDDEIVLCLNYDGKFGLNSINQYFQNANTMSEAVPWAEWSFKCGDKILFLDTQRFNVLYNNLKGRIVSIEKYDDRIRFTIDAQTAISREKCQNEGIEFVEGDSDKTRIRFEVLAWDDEMTEEDKTKTIIPFQLAYAVSIHKAQGLEYNSVKVIIPPNNEEKITHPIFYTAITRTKEKLKIFWSAETMNTIVKSFSENEVEPISLEIIKNRLQRC